MSVHAADLINSREAADSCGVALITFQKWSKAGLISPVGKDGRSFLYRRGEAEALGFDREPKSAVTRIFSKVRDMPNGCLEWQGQRTERGYGRMRLNMRSVIVSRLVAHLFLGLDLDDPSVLVCHHCDNPPCVNPMHLFLGSTHDNWLDSITKGRQSRRPSSFVHPPSEVCQRGHDFSVTRRFAKSGNAFCSVCRAERDRERRSRAHMEVVERPGTRGGAA